MTASGTIVLPGEPRPLLVLHGHGDEPAALAELRDRLDPEGAWTVSLPRGPVDLADGSPAWFDDGDRADAERLRAALDAALAEAAAAAGAPAASTVVVGWSQGGAAALALGTWPDGPTVAGVATVAGWLPTFEHVTWSPRPGLAMLLVHGEDDEVVPLPLGRGAARHLEREGADVSWRAHPVGHELAPPVLDDVAGWLATRR